MDTSTPLTEPQARALAQWWGGTYASAPATAGAPPRHGVTLPGGAGACPAQSLPAAAVWTTEEARLMERQRHGINPAAPDWDG
jgi:hypothetical protein